MCMSDENVLVYCLVCYSWQFQVSPFGKHIYGLFLFLNIICGLFKSFLFFHNKQAHFR